MEKSMGTPFGDFCLNKEKAEKKSVGLQQEQACTSRADVSPSPVGTGQDSPAKPDPGNIACWSPAPSSSKQNTEMIDVLPRVIQRAGDIDSWFCHPALSQRECTSWLR